MACEYYYFCSDHKCSLNGRYGERVEDSYYRSYCRDNYKRCSIYKRDNKKTNSNTYNPNNSGNDSGCFITTVVCNILGKSDNDKILQDLRKFRDNVLQKDKKYDDILMSYDKVGPVISNCILNDDRKLEMARGLHDNVLLSVSELVNGKQYDRACEVYYLMTLSLINYYGLKHFYNELVDDNFGYDVGEFNRLNAGHGKKKIKSIRNGK